MRDEFEDLAFFMIVGDDSFCLEAAFDEFFARGEIELTFGFFSAMTVEAMLRKYGFYRLGK